MDPAIRPIPSIGISEVEEHTEITAPDQVQIYEDIMVGTNNLPTTGLLTAVRYIKDNRLLPRGFNKSPADAEIAVQGGALADENFTGGSAGSVQGGSGDVVSADLVSMGGEPEVLRRDGAPALRAVLRIDVVRFRRHAGKAAATR
jgi:hypothetical protein